MNRQVAALVIAGILLATGMGCASPSSYGVGIVNCLAQDLTAEIQSEGYSTRLPIPVNGGQSSRESGLTESIPSVMQFRWAVSGEDWQSREFAVASLMPEDFDYSRDSLWFVVCPSGQPLLVAEARSEEGEYVLRSLEAKPRIWAGVSGYSACDICEKESRL